MNRFPLEIKDNPVMLNAINAPLDKNLVVVGHPGTGKTVAAIHRFIKLYNERKKVIFLCYNKLLREWIIKTIVEVFNLPEYIGDFVRTIDSFFGKIQRKYGIKENEIKYVNEMTVDEIKKLVDYYSSIEKYDAIIIDEGQDFSLEILENLEKLTNHISIFMDKLQIVNFFTGHTQIDYNFLEEKKDYNLLFLTKNYRTPRNIYETAISWFVSESEELIFTESIISEKGEIHRMKNIGLKEVVEDIVNFTKNSKGSLGVFLSKVVNVEKLYSTLINFLGEEKVYIYTSQDKYEDIKFDNKVVVTTFKSAKGLEFDNVVVLITPEDKKIQNINKQLFVLSTRTRGNIKFYFLNDNHL